MNVGFLHAAREIPHTPVPWLRHADGNMALPDNRPIEALWNGPCSTAMVLVARPMPQLGHVVPVLPNENTKSRGLYARP
jgi:hypothetical protein